MRSSVLVCALLAACGSVSANPDSSVPIDSGTATDGPSIADAPAVDSPPLADAGPPDAVPSGPLTVHVWQSGGPAPGVDVVLHDSEGAVLDRSYTGSTGTVVFADVSADSMVTVAMVDGSDYRLTTVMGAGPNDVIDFGDKIGSSTSTQEGLLTVNLPGSAPGPADSYTYNVYVGCSSYWGANLGSAVSLTINSDCFRDSTTLSVLVVAFVSGEPVAYAVETGVTMSGTAPDRTGTVYFSTWRSDFAELDGTVTNAPSGASALMPNLAVYANGLSYEAWSSGSIDLTAGDGTFTGTYPKGLADVVYLMIYLSFGAANQLSIYGMPYTTSVPTSVELDLSTDFLPAIIDVVADSTDPARPTYGWGTATTAVGADFAIVQAQYQQSSPTYVYWSWEIIAPPDVSLPLQAPELPAALSAFVPSPAATLQNAMMGLIDLTVTESYHDFLNTYGASLFEGGEGPPTDTGLRYSIGSVSSGG
jgi:hypothetical protein